MISDGYGDGIRLSVFCSSLINWRRNFKISSLQVTDSATEMATYFFGGESGGQEVATELKIRRYQRRIFRRPTPGKKNLSRRLSVAMFNFF